MKEETYVFHVNGMHCQSCVMLTELELEKLPEVREAKARLADHSVTVTGTFGDKSPQHVARDLSEVMIPHGYSLAIERARHNARWMEFRYAVPIAAALVIGFLMLQKAGIVNVIGEGDVTIATALLIGLVASVSTCMAVVGGLVLSFSANYAKGGQPWRAQVIFHISRLASFFVFGGAIGALGAVFQLGRVGMAVMSGLIAVVLLVLGVNLLDVFPWAKRLQPMLPGWLSRKTMRERKQWSGGIAPVLLGAGTFFLPCGFTQSMQIYTLGTGDFAAGALTMTAFALGTLPVLAMLSFTSFGFRDKSWSGIFFKTAGLVVIFFALFNLLNSLAVAGVIPPVFSI